MPLKVKKKIAKKRSAKAPKIIIQKISKRAKESEPEKLAAEVERGIQALLKRGKERGFVTYSEILYYFPTIEEDIVLLEDLYARLEKENIQVLETKEFIEGEKKVEAKTEEKRRKKDEAIDFDQMSQDSVQM